VAELTTSVVAAIEQAAISGLCRDGQLEIAVQTARELKPNLDSVELFALVTTIYEDWLIGD